MVDALNIENATYISTFFNYISIAILFYITKKEGFGFNEIPKSIQNLIKIWLIWSIFNLIRGIFIAQDYYDWKFLLLSSFSFSLIPLVFFIGKNVNYAINIFKFVIKYLFLYGFLFIPLTLTTNHELYSRLMIPLSLFILFFPFLKFNWKILIIIVGTISVLMAIEFRSNIIKIAFSILILLIYYFRNYIRLSWIRLFHFFLFAIPIVFLSLAVTNKYNIFEKLSKGEAYTVTNSEGKEENLATDSRTFLYAEVFKSINKSGNWLIGSSAAGSYQSDWFYNDGGAIEGKRYGSEVGILNILLRYGIIGVIIYFVMLYVVSYNAIQSSSNILSKMIGLFIAFRWTYCFVEEFTQYDLNFYFFWLAIGLVSSASFRNMDDTEIKTIFKLL
jgi:hypothetical protein